MTSTFEYVDGTLCLKTHDTMSDEPLAIVAHYPFCKVIHSDCEHLIGQPAIFVCSGVYAAYLRGQVLEFRLESGGSTKPIKFEKVPIEQPRTKRNTRWHYGKWQALFKTGWQTI